MSSEWQDLVKEFHVGCGSYIPPTHEPAHREQKSALRCNLLWEEIQEYFEAEDSGHSLEDVAKELADIIYIVLGTCVDYGINMDAVFREVHRSNMTKFVDGKAVRREDGKILKGPNFSPADIAGVLASV